MEWLIGIAVLTGALWIVRQSFKPGNRDTGSPEALLASVDAAWECIRNCEDEAQRLKSTARDPSLALAAAKKIDARTGELAQGALANIARYLETPHPDTRQARAMTSGIKADVETIDQMLRTIRDAAERAQRQGSAPTATEPWLGRQHNLVQDPDDRPNSAESWEAVYNRAVTDTLRFDIEYADDDGIVSQRTITPKSIHLVRHEPWVYIKAHCSLRGDERTFRSDRILRTKNLQTNRALKDLGQYLRGRY